MKDCMRQIQTFAATGKHIDFIMTHTCPYSIEPRDMFLGFIDQSTVDDSMERWLDEVKEAAPWSFTIGSAFFDNRFGGSFADQIDKVCDYMLQPLSGQKAEK